MSSDIHNPDPADPSAATTSARGDAVLLPGSGSTDSSHTAIGLPPFLMSMEGDWQSEKTVISARPPAIADMQPPRNSATLGEMLVGKSLDHYELVEFVGGGGMGAVFRSNDTRLGRTVAVKVLSRDHNDEETIRRFRNEAQSAARLDHPNIARVHYVGEASGFNYIVFEFIEGTNARDWVVKNGPMSVADCLRLAYKLAEALEHASQREVVHRDIKPSNILITEDGQVKLVDMGLARLQMEASQDDLTESGVTLGTFDYISPEQARDPRLADVRSDIYSLGCTLFFLLSGQPPFPDGTALQKLLKHNGDEPPDLRDFRDDLPDHLFRIVQRMLAKKPSLRFQTAAELAAEVAKTAEEVGIALELPYLAQPTAANNTWQPWLMSLAISGPIALMLLLVILLDWILPTSLAGVQPFQPKLEPAFVALEEVPATEPEAEDAEPADRIAIPAITTGAGVASGIVPTRPAEVASNNTQKNNPSVPATDPLKPPVLATTLPADTIPMRNPGDLPAPLPPGIDLPAGTTPMTPPSPSPMGPPSEAAPGFRPRALTKVVVRNVAAPSEGVVDQLGAALKLAAEKNVSEIELQFDGPLFERPLVIGSKEITIRAGAGYRPVIVFRPSAGNLNDEQRMVRFDGNGLPAVRLQGIEFRLELPQQTSSLGWSLFSLGQIRSLTLDECLLTVVNQAAGGGTLHYPVAMFEVLPPRVVDSMMEGKAMMPTTTLQINRSVIRGEAMLISMQEEVPLDFSWQEGVLAISDSILSSQGATVKHKGFGRIDLRWEHVSAYAGGGMYQLRRKDEAAYQLDLNIRCDHCLLRWGRDAALFDLQNGPLSSDVRLQFDGLENSYESSDRLFLRVRPKGLMAAEYPLDDRSEWSSERGARYDIVVSRDGDETMLPLHQWYVRELAVQDENAYLGIGCDPGRLPLMYVAPSTPAAATIPQKEEAAQEILDIEAAN